MYVVLRTGGSPVVGELYVSIKEVPVPNLDPYATSLKTETKVDTVALMNPMTVAHMMGQGPGSVISGRPNITSMTVGTVIPIEGVLYIDAESIMMIGLAREQLLEDIGYNKAFPRNDPELPGIVIGQMGPKR